VFGVPEDSGDVREKQVRQEPPAYDLAGFEHLRKRQNLGASSSIIPTLGVLSQDREEIQQPCGLFSCRTPLGRGGVREQVVGEMRRRSSACARAPKSKMYAFSFWNTSPARSKVQGFCARNAALHVRARGGQLESMMTAVHSGTVTPVVSWPDRQSDGLPIDSSPSAMARDLVQGDAALTGSVPSSVRPSPAARTTAYSLQYVVLLRKPLHSLGRGHAVEQPEGMADLGRATPPWRTVLSRGR